ncbi:Lrp/AsnC family transcriptional regulator [Labrys portucalensis]|uniref:Lrp/AsnC family transcriptional regulator n=1 Tax=Labrys neptuniae TaxID=376174 RepID=A0ABV6Z9P8_9HYPH|nr:Lrp/AsnC family transcriptional regulator [Labrys neptuniae]MDT3378080.1 Lrp/AsnC family transcriptional regulator [Labrys neptuniae]
MPRISGSSLELDGFDVAILAILQRDNHTPQRKIAEAIHLSAPAVQRRIRRLEESGVITANVATLDPAKIGQPLTIVVNVDLERERSVLIDEAKKAFLAEASVQQCYYVAGETDFVLILNVPSMADYEALTRRLFFANNNVKRFRTFVVMDRVKTGTTLSLDKVPGISTPQ